MQNKVTMMFLVEKARHKNPDAFTELMQQYTKEMYRVAIAILMNDEDAADAIQDTILVCWEKIDTLKHIPFFRTWITRILINKCYDIRNKRGNMVDLEEWQEPQVQAESNIELKEALSSLEEKYRVPITLYYCEGYSTSDIGKVLDIPTSTVRTRLARGREQLANYYAE